MYGYSLTPKHNWILKNPKPSPIALNPQYT